MFNPRARGTPEIESQIVAVRMIFPPQGFLTSPAEIDDFVEFLGIRVPEQEMCGLPEEDRMYGKRFRTRRRLPR
jgi:hypothetical protein